MIGSLKRCIISRSVGRWLPLKSLVLKHLKSTSVEPGHSTLCIFAHFDSGNRIDPHVLYYLEQLKNAGCDIMLVSTCRHLNQDDCGKALNYCTDIILRKNIGYDFGSYRLGLQLKKDEIAKRYKHVLISNDSVYGPFHNLHNIIEKMKTAECDVWGMTDSFQQEYHLQSYFIMFKAAVLQHPNIIKFWDGIRYNLKKADIINKYEIGLSRALRNNSLQMMALCSYEDVQQAAIKSWMSILTEIKNETSESRPHSEIKGEWFDRAPFVFGASEILKKTYTTLARPCNPTHEFWDTLIDKYGFPFVKVELLRKNPDKIPNLFKLDSILVGTGYDVAMIRKHHRRAG